jgi:hypothetical protein
MRNPLISIVILLFLVMSACSETERPAETNEPTVEELEAKVAENCHILLDALEEFRILNVGLYPASVYTDTNDLGLSVVDHLPDGQLLENPFTGLRTEPVDTIATESGQVGYYKMYPCYYGLYYINGYGEHCTITELSNLDELEPKVIENCLILREAAEEFADLNNGSFPGDLSERTPGGQTLIDLLPGGTHLENPFTLARAEPVDGAACNVGETGYVCVSGGGGVNVGYTITGCGYIGYDIFFWYQTDSDTCHIEYGVTIYCTE